MLGRSVERLDQIIDFATTQTNNFNYNNRSEVIAAMMGTNEYAYIFDNIGNRESATNNGVSTSYSANNLNQYEEIVATETNVPIFDLDGNMTEWDGWTFTWNGENRMVSATNSEHQISWAYDYAGRCFEKVKDGVTNSFVWNGMNIISEMNNSTTNFNVWGIDLSGRLQGAGGVGGLLAVNQNGDTYFTAYDGNGNITAYVDDTGAVVANREYSPFGITISLTGSKPDDFTHWWSTKPWDKDTELSEYEFRMYLVELGRWISKDPIEEWGGLNLYGFVGNVPVNIYDVLGNWWSPPPWVSQGPGVPPPPSPGAGDHFWWNQYWNNQTYGDEPVYQEWFDNHPSTPNFQLHFFNYVSEQLGSSICENRPTSVGPIYNDPPPEGEGPRINYGNPFTISNVGFHTEDITIEWTQNNDGTWNYVWSTEVEATQGLGFDYPDNIDSLADLSELAWWAWVSDPIDFGFFQIPNWVPTGTLLLGTYPMSGSGTCPCGD